jgi:inosose dehydratase
MRFALSPLQWLATEDGWIDFTGGPPFDELVQQVASLGFAGLAAGIDPGLAVPGYLETLGAAGLQPAPGYLSCPLDEPAARIAFVERADEMARIHARLGLAEMYVAASMAPDAPRVRVPAKGLDSDERRLATIAASLELIASAAAKHGVVVCLHQHVGTWIETGDELSWLLERLDPGLVALGPDTGHLAWAGVDLVAFVSEHRDRIRSLHVKDLRLAVAVESKDRSRGYRETVKAGLWVEPGRGDLDLEAVLAAVGAERDMWAIIEVDRPDLESPTASARACADWMRTVAG